MLQNVRYYCVYFPFHFSIFYSRHFFFSLSLLLSFLSESPISSWRNSATDLETDDDHVRVGMHALSICSSYCSCGRREPSQGQEKCSTPHSNPGTSCPWEKYTTEQERTSRPHFTSLRRTFLMPSHTLTNKIYIYCFFKCKTIVIQRLLNRWEFVRQNNVPLELLIKQKVLYPSHLEWQGRVSHDLWT